MHSCELAAGTTIDDFVVGERLGAGGMGVVYKARQRSLNRVVALKVFDATHAHPNEVTRFHRAAHAAARLRHPNVAAVYAAGEAAGICYLAMEYVDGASFQQITRLLVAAPAGLLVKLPTSDNESSWFAFANVLAERTGTDGGVSRLVQPTAVNLIDLAVHPPATVAEGEDGTPTTVEPGGVGPGPPLSVAAHMMSSRPAYHHTCCTWVRDAARGLQHAHDLGVTHRDVKPGNLMLGRDGQVRIIDFGLARCFDDATLTAAGQLLGSPLYMSPEQLTGRIELTGKTDVYSLGLVLYELLALGPPLVARNREELFLRVLVKPLEPLARVNPSVSPAVEAVVHKAAAKDPDDRHESAGAFADDLDRVLSGMPVRAPAYRPRDDDAVALNTRPAIIPTLAAQFYIAAFAWLAYASFLMSVKDAPGRDRVPFPLLGFGWYGGAVAYAVGGLYFGAAVWMARGYRAGYWVGWGGQLAMAVSTVLFVVTMNALRAFEDSGRMLRMAFGGVVFLVWLGWQGRQYGRRPVRSWFTSVRRVREGERGASGRRPIRLNL